VSGSSDRRTRRAELREQVQQRSYGRCEWPQCSESGGELAHAHSIGVGGRASADTLDNVAWLCHMHARFSDGEYADYGSDAYHTAHRALLGARYDTMPAHFVAYERAEALTALLRDRTAGRLPL